MPPDSDLHDSVEKARHAFRRLVAEEGDGVLPPPHAEDDAPEHEAGKREGLGAGERPLRAGLHPFFRGLLETLPDPGVDWPRPKREQWLETARSIFALIYGDPGEEREPVRLTEIRRDSAGSQLDQRAG